MIGEGSGGRLFVRAHAAPSGYFSLMGIPVVRGRDFDVARHEDPTAIVIDTGAASRLWPRADPIGMALGLALSVIVVRLLAVLQGSESPSGIAAVAVGIAGVALIVAAVATWIPARRAASVDPLRALRVE